MTTEQLEKQLTRVHEWIRSADQKNSIFLALIAGISAVFAKPFSGVLRANIQNYSPLQRLLITLSLEILAWSIIRSLLCLKPSLNAKAKSLTYFGSIASMRLDNYKLMLSRVKVNAYYDELIEQIYISSKIADTKHRQLAGAILLFMISVVLLLIGLVV